HHRQKPALQSRRRVNATDVGEMLANNDVVVSHQTRQRADRQYDREGRVSGSQKCGAKDVSLAGAPVAVEQGGGSLQIDVSGPMDAYAIHARHWFDGWSCSGKQIRTRRHWSHSSLCGILRERPDGRQIEQRLPAKQAKPQQRANDAVALTETPSTKLQAPEKFQISNTKPQNTWGKTARSSVFELGAWCFFGVWNLELVAWLLKK